MLVEGLLKTFKQKSNLVVRSIRLKHHLYTTVQTPRAASEPWGACNQPEPLRDTQIWGGWAPTHLEILTNPMSLRGREHLRGPPSNAAWMPQNLGQTLVPGEVMDSQPPTTVSLLSLHHSGGLWLSRFVIHPSFPMGGNENLETGPFSKGG